MTAAPSPSVIPLRIHKHSTPETSQSSEPRLSAGSDIFQQLGGPLSEISLMEGRRNSQSSDKIARPTSKADECASSSPAPGPGKTNSPMAFWQGRDLQENSRNRDNSPSVGRRSSIERLKRASRVQNNSKLFQQSSPARPMSYHGAQTSPLGSPFGSPPFARNNTLRESPSGEKSRIPLPASKSPSTPPKQKPAPGFNSPNNRASPTKSSLLSSYKTNSYDPDSDGEIREINRSPVRRPKSVTFDKEAPHVLEYEMVTPDPSVDGSPGGRFDSDDDEEEEEDEDDDDILDNTPVIEPDGWSRMTPERESSHPHLDDPFQMTPSPTGRPLPPIPGYMMGDGSGGISANRPLPTVPNHFSNGEDDSMSEVKEESHVADESFEGLGITVNRESEMDLQNEVGHETMSPVLLQEEDSSDDETSEPGSVQKQDEESSASSYEDPGSDYKAPRLSRESIRRQVQALRNQDEEQDIEEAEGDIVAEDTKPSEEVYIKPEPSDDDGIDISSIPEFHDIPQRPASRFGTRLPDPDEVSEPSTYNGNDDDESRYSDPEEEEEVQSDTTRESTTPIATPAPRSDNEPYMGLEAPKAEAGEDVGLPDFGSFLGDEGLGLKQYMTPSPPPPPTPKPEEGPSTLSIRDSLVATQEQTLERSDDDSGDDDDTGSVIRHKIFRSDDEGDIDEDYGSEYDDEESAQRSPSPVEEAVATIRAPGGKLKTRASATPSDMASMAAARRQVSGDQSNPPPVPKIPSGYRSEGDIEGSSDSDEQVEGAARSGQARLSNTPLPALGEFEFDLKLDDLNDEFDRVIEKEKRGYLMRQNTRVIHASSRDPEEDDGVPSPPRPGHARGQSWSVEPWRSSQRRRSQREFGRKRPSTGPIPPLPGQESVTEKRLPSVDENETTGRSSLGSTGEDNGERGRLFVKVVGVKDLSLPMPQGQPTYFCLTLDNGLHCVTTSWLELARNAPIGQEFELVVLNELEFQLTLQAKIEQPPPPPPKSVTKTPVAKQKPQKQSTFSKVFSTPKRRKQMEQQQQQQQEQQLQQQQREEKLATAAPLTAWDLLHGLVARDGSFARSYVCLKDFETRAFGRPFTTDIHCFNEWAIDASSVKGKKGVQSGLQPARKAPYKIGKLELQLFFVPKPKGCQDTDLPKSMNAAMREMREADTVLSREWEGNLSQQGGDCPFWRRRFFKLNGARLTAYHEATRQPRATINLTKAVKLIDDRNSLVDPTVPGPGKSRRKSGFSEEEEGYMFVEEGFRIRFGNGEVIDFYADSPEDKKGWMKVLGETIGRVPDQRSWVQTVLTHERKQKAEHGRAEAKMRPPQPQPQSRQQRNSLVPTEPQQRRQSLGPGERQQRNSLVPGGNPRQYPPSSAPLQPRPQSQRPYR